MHIVKIQGGLGNQMFQYALYRKFQSMGYDTYADLSMYRNKNETRIFDLPIFGIQLREADKRDIKRLYMNTHNYFDKIWIRLFGKKTYFKEKGLFFDQSVLMQPEGYFNGYWQSQKYFFDISDALYRELQFPELPKGHNREIQEQIKGDEYSVSIHVRLGDYLNNPGLYGGICTAEYYAEAITYMKKRLGNPHFYIFSNGIDMVKEQFKGEEFTFIENNNESNGYIDMQLMSSCKHQIIANSSFSWWGAWLNQNEEKIVIAPKRWLNGVTTRDVVPVEWIRLGE